MKTLFTLLVCAAAAWSTPLAAQSAGGPANEGSFTVVQARTLDDLLTQLQAAGFTVDDISRTFLGRIRVVARDATTTREIVMSRTTGEIFSDVSRSLAPRAAQPEPARPATGNAQGNGRADDRGSAASGGQSEGHGRSDNGSNRSNAARDNGGAGRSNRSD